jgi:hypothetical protein
VIPGVPAPLGGVAPAGGEGTLLSFRELGSGPLAVPRSSALCGCGTAATGGRGGGEVAGRDAVPVDDFIISADTLVEAAEQHHRERISGLFSD